MSFVIQCRDKDDGDFCTHSGQPTAQIEPGHAPQLDVENEAVDRPGGVILQKGLSGRIDRSRETSRPQQTPDGPRKALVVIHHGDTDFAFIHQIDFG